MNRTELLSKLPAAALAIGLGAVTLVGCAAETFDESQPATITDHIHHPAYDSIIIVNKVPIVIYHPEEFDLELQQCEPATDNTEPKCAEETVQVDEDIYHQFHDGDIVIVADIT